MDKQVEVFGQTYSIGRMDAMKELHVSRRLAPLMAGFGASAFSLAQSGKDSVDDGAMLQVFGPVVEALSKMKDDDVEYIIRTCLAVVKRRDGGLWVPIQNGTQLQYQDITMQCMMRLTVEVVQERLGGFFGLLPGGSNSTQG
jgi:hypothetical protein